jgi:hypothetical protein
MTNPVDLEARILFLDFDGVLHPTACEVDRHFCNRERLESWLRSRPDVGVVISSSRREEHSLDELRSFFSADLKSRVIGVTPVFDEQPSPIDQRHSEILSWPQSRSGQYRWAILDYQFLRFPQGHRELVATNGDVGLTQADLKRVDSVLGFVTTEDELKLWTGGAPVERGVSNCPGRCHALFRMSAA